MIIKIKEWNAKNKKIKNKKEKEENNLEIVRGEGWLLLYHYFLLLSIRPKKNKMEECFFKKIQLSTKTVANNKPELRNPSSSC